MKELVDTVLTIFVIVSLIAIIVVPGILIAKNLRKK